MLTCITSATEKWKLQELDNIVDAFDNDLFCVLTETQLKLGQNYENVVAFLASKSIVTFREVITLCNTGFPDGALSLSRNLFEQFVVLNFFEAKKNSSAFSNYISDYFLDYDVKQYKALIFEYENLDGNEEELQKYNAKLNKCKTELAHQKVKGDYWWSGYSSFKDLVDYVISILPAECQYAFNLLHYTYIRSCVSLHSSILGNFLRLGNTKDFEGIDTSPTLDNHDIPLWFATFSFNMIVEVACRIFNIDASKYQKELHDLIFYYYKSNSSEVHNA